MSNSRVSAKNLVEQTTGELVNQRILFKKELFNLRFQKTLGELKNTSRVSFVKKTIARINTELTIRLKLGNK
jgi:large subunit ribosomal protein L29